MCQVGGSNPSRVPCWNVPKSVLLEHSGPANQPCCGGTLDGVHACTRLHSSSSPWIGSFSLCSSLTWVSRSGGQVCMCAYGSLTHAPGHSFQSSQSRACN